MAKKAYVGVNSKARRVRKIYVGISNKARRVRKGYIGIAGKARLFFSGKGTLVFREDYLESTQRSPAASNNSFAFVAGDNATKTFNTQLTAGTTSGLSVVRKCLGTNAAGQYAVFGAKRVGDANSDSDLTVDAFNTSATRVSATPFSIRTLNYEVGYNDNYAIFGSGTVSSTPDTPDGAYNAVRLYDASLVQTVVTAQGHGTRYCISNNGTYAVIFSGGYYFNGSNPYWATHVCVDAINTSGTLTSVPDLSLGDGAMYAIGVRAGNYAICAGGCMEGFIDGVKHTVTIKRVNAYNQSLTMSIATPLTYGTSIMGNDQGATADEDFGIIPTINTSGSSYVGYYEVYDSDLTRQMFNRSGSGYGYYIPAAASFRRYGIFLRGSNGGSTEYTNVDVFEVT